MTQTACAASSATANRPSSASPRGRRSRSRTSGREARSVSSYQSRCAHRSSLVSTPCELRDMPWKPEMATNRMDTCPMGHVRRCNPYPRREGISGIRRALHRTTCRSVSPESSPGEAFEGPRTRAQSDRCESHPGCRRAPGRRFCPTYEDRGVTWARDDRPAPR